MPAAVQLSERERRPGCREIRVDGELDLAVSGQLEEALDRALASDCERLLVGLADCEFIDSTCIAALVRAHGRMAEQERRLLIYGPSSQVSRVLSITGLTGNGMVFATAEEALSASDPR